MNFDFRAQNKNQQKYSTKQIHVFRLSLIFIRFKS